MERNKAVEGALRDIILALPHLTYDELEIIRQRLEWLWQIGYETSGIHYPTGRKPVEMYDRKGVLLDTFPSLKAASDAVGMTRKAILQAARYGYLTYKGYYWRLTKD